MENTNNNINYLRCKRNHEKYSEGQQLITNYFPNESDLSDNLINIIPLNKRKINNNKLEIYPFPEQLDYSDQNITEKQVNNEIILDNIIVPILLINEYQYFDSLNFIKETETLTSLKNHYHAISTKKEKTFGVPIELINEIDNYFIEDKNNYISFVEQN